MTLATVDYVLLAFVVLVGLFGLFRGVFRELVSLIFLALSVILAGLFYQKLNTFLGAYIKSPEWAPLISFLVIFALVLFVGWVLSAITFAILPGSRGAISTILGGVLGIVRGACLVFLLLILLDHLQVQDHSCLQTEVAKMLPTLEAAPVVSSKLSTQK